MNTLFILQRVSLGTLTIFVTYYLASFIQTVFHRFFGHSPKSGKIYDTHVRGHHAQYSKVLITDHWIPSERHITWYYAIPFTPMVCLAFWLLPTSLFIAHTSTLLWAIWWHIYLHRHYHIRGSWFEKFRWFQRKRHLHFIHHKRPHSNYAIVEYSWDRLLGTLDEKESERTPCLGCSCGNLCAQSKAPLFRETEEKEKTSQFARFKAFLRAQTSKIKASLQYSGGEG